MISPLGRPYCFSRSRLMNSRFAPQLPLLPLSPLFSITCALFSATQPSQLLSHQSLPDSFPCNGGRVCSLALSPNHHRLATPQFTPNRLLLFSVTYGLPNLQVPCFDHVATVGGVGGVPLGFGGCAGRGVSLAPYFLFWFEEFVQKEVRQSMRVVAQNSMLLN